MTPAALYLPSPDQERTAAVFREWRGVWPGCGALVLLAEADRQSVTEIQAAARGADVPLVGAIFPALLSEAGFLSGGVWLLPLETMPPHVLLENPGRGEAAAAALHRALAPALAASERPATLLLLFDAMTPDISSILDALYLFLADRVGYAGANAGSETFQPMPCLFDGERLLGDGILALLLDAPGGAVLEHGYQAPPELISATATQGNRIESIDWAPAFQVYREKVRALYGVELTPENFYQYGVHFPFGILLANGQVVVRIPVALAEDGALFCVGEVPANSMLSLLQAPAVDSVHTILTLAQRLNREFRLDENGDLLTFYCAGRRLHLGDASALELDLLHRRSGCRRLVGALSLGEIGSMGEGGYPRFHNATLVCRPWGDASGEGRGAP